jgi:hypothetical protein
MTITKNGQTIDTLEEWGKFAPPKSAVQWKDDASAKEAARCWLSVTSPSLPRELEALLATNAAFGPVQQWHAEPEALLPFDEHGGEPRSTDLLVHARDHHGAFLIAVEAKVNESFGSRVSKMIAVAKGRKTRNPLSTATARAERLVESILGAKNVNDPAVASLRYQLLTAAAGVVNAGRTRGIDRVVLLAQEFRTRTSMESSQAANANDLEHFLLLLSHGSVPSMDAGRLYGPFTVPGSPLFQPPIPSLFVGKIVCDVRSAR